MYYYVCYWYVRCEDLWLFLEARCMEGADLDTIIIRISTSNKYVQLQNLKHLDVCILHYQEQQVASTKESARTSASVQSDSL